MAKSYGLGPKAVARLQEMSAAERARNKNPTDPAGTGSAPVLFAPCIVRITSTIGAREGTTPGTGTVDMWLIRDDELEQNSAEATKTIYNLGLSTIPGSTTDPIYALATQVRGGAFVLTHVPALCDSLAELTGYSTAPTNPLILMVTTASPNCAQWVAGSTCT